MAKGVDVFVLCAVGVTVFMATSFKLWREKTDQGKNLRSAIEPIRTARNKNRNIPDWQKYKHVEKGQNCLSPLRFFTQKSKRPIVAISSFPGSGNTWARHLLHMASGYWTGNRRTANDLKAAGWIAEDENCESRTTLAQKTHRLHDNKGKNKIFRKVFHPNLQLS